MTAIYYDSPMSDEARRARLFAGDLFVYSATPASRALIGFARETVERAFAPHHPPEAQHLLDSERYVDILAALKPEFINHPRSKELLAAVLTALGSDPDLTYFDVPRLRTMTSEFLNAGLTLQFHPHRDTWFSAPMCQINWWIPVYEVETTNVMAFHPRYFDEGVQNSSRIYNYGEWTRTGRKAAAAQVHQETRRQPEPEQEIEREPEIRVVTPPGGILVFSGAQLHTTVPNTSGRTRFSIDFRTVDRRDVETRDGARNVDSACTGTTLGDYLRVRDLARLPEDLVKSYDDAPAGVGA